MKRFVSLLLVLISLVEILEAQEKTPVELSGDILEYAMPSAALASTFIWTDDSKAHWQFIKSLGLAVGTAYILKQTVDKARPDFNPYDPRYDAFPSGHTTSAFLSAAFVERRYGWKVGLPAYAVAGYVAWSRVYAERHDWWDVLGGACIGTASAYLFTKAYDSNQLDLALDLSSEHFQLGFTYRF